MRKRYSKILWGPIGGPTSSGGLTIPRTGLLFYSRLPNTEDILWDEDALFDENMLWGGWVLPVECYAAVGTGFWFTDETTPVAKTGAEILAWAATNQYHVMFSLAKGLAVYDPYTTTDSVINKAHRYFKADRYDDTPTAFFNGVDITGSTSFDSGVLGTNPGQWVLDNTGTLVNAGVDVPAMEGMRLDGTTWRDTTITGEPILPSVNQATRIGNTDFTEFTPSTTFMKYTRTNPATDMPGFLSEPARTNKCTCRKANPVDTTNLTKSGDAASVLSVVDDTAALTAAGLIGVCNSGKVYKLDNSLGVAVSYVDVSGTSVNANTHSISLFARGSGNARIAMQNSNPADSTLTAVFQRFCNTVTPSSAGLMSLRVAAGAIIYFILPQLEEGAFCTSPIAKLQGGTDPLTAITRAGTVLTYPTAGKIRSNNMAFRMTVVPRASGQASVYLFSTRTDANNYTDINLYSNGVAFRKVISGVSTPCSVGSTPMTSGTSVQVLAVISANTGMRIASRLISGAWTNGTLVSSEAGKANMSISTNYQLGSLNSLNQFTGNISELDTLFIPEGITDPLAWAKAQWGLPA